MMLPNGDRAIVDLAKLVNYCLDPTHPRGKHKAKVFAASLGFLLPDAAQLRALLLAAARTSSNALPGLADPYGTRYLLDVSMTGPLGSGVVRSAWIILASEDFPRLTSCYVLV